jgi:hypothetical protein
VKKYFDTSLINCPRRYDPYAADGEKKEDDKVASEKGFVFGNAMVEN